MSSKQKITIDALLFETINIRKNVKTDKSKAIYEEEFWMKQIKMK